MSRGPNLSEQSRMLIYKIPDSFKVKGANDQNGCCYFSHCFIVLVDLVLQHSALNVIVPRLVYCTRHSQMIARGIHDDENYLNKSPTFFLLLLWGIISEVIPLKSKTDDSISLQQRLFYSMWNIVFLKFSGNFLPTTKLNPKLQKSYADE